MKLNRMIMEVLARALWNTMTMILENTGLDNLTCTLAGQERSRMMILVRRLRWIWSENGTYTFLGITADTYWVQSDL